RLGVRGRIRVCKRRIHVGSREGGGHRIRQLRARCCRTIYRRIREEGSAVAIARKVPRGVNGVVPGESNGVGARSVGYDKRGQIGARVIGHVIERSRRIADVREIDLVVARKARFVPVKSAACSSVSRPAASAAKVTSAEDAAPNPSVPAPLIIACPEPVTSPLIVMLPPCAQINPEFAISLLTISPPLPVAARVPLLVTTFAPVSMTRAWKPVATIVPSLTSVICPAPSWPAPEM